MEITIKPQRNFIHANVSGQDTRLKVTIVIPAIELENEDGDLLIRIDDVKLKTKIAFVSASN